MSEKQIGGDHYRRFPIQPVTYIQMNGLNFLQGNAVKYITRAPFKGGIEDINKAIHCLEMWRDQLVQQAEIEEAELELERQHEWAMAEASGYEV